MISPAMKENEMTHDEARKLMEDEGCTCSITGILDRLGHHWDCPSRKAEPTMTDTEQLIASLTTTNPDTDGVYFEDGRYFDWSTRTASGVRMEAGDDAEAAQVEMSRDDVVRLQRALTLWLLQNPA